MPPLDSIYCEFCLKNVDADCFNIVTDRCKDICNDCRIKNYVENKSILCPRENC